MPDAILCIQTAYHLAWFFIFSPPAWAGICRTARQGCLIPYSSLSRCNIPRTPLRLSCSPAEVSLSPGFSRQDATAAPYRGCRSYFSFSCYGSSFYLYKSTATCFSTDKYLSAKLSPHHLYQCSRCFVSLHTDILFRQIKPAETFVVKVHSLPSGIYLHSILPFILQLQACPELSQKQIVPGSSATTGSFLYFTAFMVSAIYSRTCTKNTACFSVLSRKTLCALAAHSPFTVPSEFLMAISASNTSVILWYVSSPGFLSPFSIFFR